MIQQKSTELLFSLLLANHTFTDLERGIAQVLHVQKMFGLLAGDLANMVPYDCDLVEECKKYADSMLHHAEEHLSMQWQYKAEQARQLEGAQQKRVAE
jgi:RNA polymerase-associated protein CTR9